MYDQRIEVAHLSAENAPIILNDVMDWFDLYICPKTATAIWADRLSAAVLSSNENIMRDVSHNPFPWLLLGFKVRSIPIYQEGLRYAVGHYLRWLYPDRDLMLKHLSGERELLGVVQKESHRIRELVQRIDQSLQVLAAEYVGKGLRKHLPFLKHSQTKKDANLLWLHWLNNVLLQTMSNFEPWQEFGGMFGSDFSDGVKLESWLGWIKPGEARRLDQGEVHEGELIEIWRSYTEEYKELPSVSYDDPLRRELAKILAIARHHIKDLFTWHKNKSTAVREHNEAFDTYRCVDFRDYTYPWETDTPWSKYVPKVDLQNDSTYWPVERKDYDDGSYEGGYGGTLSLTYAYDPNSLTMFSRP
jgi:hypothetical protein